MKGFIFVLFTVLGSANAIAPQDLNQHDKVYAELYASNVSHAAFVEICSKFDGTKNYTKPFKNGLRKTKKILLKEKLF